MDINIKILQSKYFNNKFSTYLYPNNSRDAYLYIYWVSAYIG